MNTLLRCPGCGAPRSSPELACSFCGAVIQEPSAGSSVLAKVPPRAFPLFRAAPLLAGVLSGAWILAAITPGAVWEPPAVAVLTGLVGLAWWAVPDQGGAPLWLLCLGALLIGKPILWPIPTGYGDTFSLTSETALTWSLPGGGLLLVAALLRKGSGRRWILPAILLLVGLAPGWFLASQVMRVRPTVVVP